MVAKKKSKNGFICFVNDWRKRHPNNLSFEQSISIAGIEWAKMSMEERLPYKTAALNYEAKKPTIKCPTKQPQKESQQKDHQKLEQQTPTLLAEDDQQKGKRQIDRIVHNSVEELELSTHRYYFIMVNYFAKTPKSDMFQPAELAISEFSLQEGIRHVYHKLINPGPSMYGSKYEAQIHANETHQLPTPPNALGEENLEELYQEILEFLRISKKDNENEFQPIFTLKEQIPIVSSSLKYLNGGFCDLKIYSIEYLFFVLKNAVCQSTGLPQPSNIYETNLILERDPYEHEVNISCDYHERLDLSKHCAKSCVTRWGFMFANYMCTDLAITMLPNCHEPENSHTYMTIVESNEKPMIKNEIMQRNNPFESQIKTECPDDNLAEDLWDDLNNLTDILEEEINNKCDVVIKTEINNDDSVAPPPPPPISLGEVNDEFAQFTRRMKTNNPNIINDEVTPIGKSSEKTKGSLKEKTRNSTTISKDISCHVRTKSPSRNGSSRRRSRSSRRDRSKSRERKPSRRDYRKSRSPRRRSKTRIHERRENNSRMVRRISRSASRERKRHRNRTLSRERSQSITRHRRSRSRSNLRKNRSIRRSRSRSRSRSRYGYSPNRRRNRSLSPVRSQHRRRSFRDRSSSSETSLSKYKSSFNGNSPSPVRMNHRGRSYRERSDSPKSYRKPSPHNENDQPLVPSNAPPYLPSSQIPIHPSTHYLPPQMSHGAMQYTQTTYSAQYYQASVPMPSSTSSYGQALLPLPSPNDFIGPYDLRHRLGPLPPTAPRFLNGDDLRHRIRGRPDYYQPPHPYPNYQNSYHDYMEAQSQYTNYRLSHEYY